MGTIYKISNTITDTVYIGSTTNFKKRKKCHIYMLNNNKHENNKLQNAWNKYGSDVFNFSIVMEDISENDLIEIEQEHINKHSKNTFNLNPIAGRPPIFKDLTFEQQEAQRNRAKNVDRSKICSIEANKKRSLAMIGRKATPEQREKMSNSKKGKSFKNKTWPGFISPEGVVYKDIKDLKSFAKQYSLRYTCLWAVATKRNKSHLGWKSI